MEEGQEPTFLPTNIPQQSAVEEDAVSPVLQLSDSGELTEESSHVTEESSHVTEESSHVTEKSKHVTEESSHVTEENDARSEEIGGYFLLSCCFDEIVCDKLLIISL